MFGNQRRTVALAVAVATIAATPLKAQGSPGSQDPGIMAAQMANGMMKSWLTQAGEQLSDADFVFQPTPDTRTLGQILGHVADLNNIFCSAAAGEPSPAGTIEKSTTTRVEILAAMGSSFAYCDGVLATMTTATASNTVRLQGRPMPALTALLFRTHHLALHYGNVVTYMRLRGKVPPSTAAMP